MNSNHDYVLLTFGLCMMQSASFLSHNARIAPSENLRFALR